MKRNLDNIQLLFDANKSDKSQRRDRLLHGPSKKLMYRSGEELNGKEIKKVLQFIDKVNTSYKGLKLPICLNFQNCKTIKDKLSYIMLEIICFDLIQHQKRKVEVIFTQLNISIITEGMNNSCLKYLIPDSRYNIDKFKSCFLMHIHGSHFRKIIMCDESINENGLGKLMNDVDMFMNFLGVDAENRLIFSETIVELVGNSIEHSKSSCLLDIDISDKYIKKVKGKKQEGNYYAVNIAILSFSHLLFGDLLKNRNITPNDGERYLTVKNAYKNHLRYFDEVYDENCFFTLASLQNKISGSEKKKVSGGKGMTCLIKSLEKQSEDHSCYMLTGNKALFFLPDLLKYNSEDWLGFNEKNDFLNDKPDEKCFTSCKVNMPGTAYNLNFIFKENGECI